MFKENNGKQRPIENLTPIIRIASLVMMTLNLKVLQSTELKTIIL